MRLLTLADRRVEARCSGLFGCGETAQLHDCDCDTRGTHSFRSFLHPPSLSAPGKCRDFEMFAHAQSARQRRKMSPGGGPAHGKNAGKIEPQTPASVLFSTRSVEQLNDASAATAWGTRQARQAATFKHITRGCPALGLRDDAAAVLALSPAAAGTRQRHTGREKRKLRSGGNAAD